jgi:hypothetical protein
LRDPERTTRPRPRRHAAPVTALLGAVLGAVLLAGCSSNKVEEYDANADAEEIYRKA